MFKDIDIRFVDKEITPFGGLSLFLKMVERCGFVPDPRKHAPHSKAFGTLSTTFLYPTVSNDRFGLKTLHESI